MNKLKHILLPISVLCLLFFYQNCAKDIDLQQFSKDQNSIELEIPVLSAAQETLTLDEGGVATLAFLIRGSNLQFSWFKDDEPMQDVGQTSVYQISNVQTSHSGVYRLCAENVRGTSCAEMQLVVNPLGPEPSPTPDPTTPSPTPNPGVNCQCIPLTCTGNNTWFPVAAPVYFQAGSVDECYASGNIPPTQSFCSQTDQGIMCTLQ